MTEHETPETHVLPVRSIADLLGVVPYHLRHTPTDSLVPVGLHGPEAVLLGRADLPEADAATSDIHACLYASAPIVARQAREAVLIGYGPADRVEPGQPYEVVDYFRVYRCDPELTLAVPALTDGQPPLVIGIAALGGGTLGRAYASNTWVYAVHLDGELVASGADLHSGAIDQTHRQMAAALAVYLADTDTVPALAGHTDRLSLWATTWKPGTAMTDLEIVTDGRYPGWRARIVTDNEAGQPWGDALAPALLVERGHCEWASEVYQSKAADRILEASRRLDPVVFERYLRLAHGTTAIEQISDRDLTVITFDTADYREHVGLLGPAELTGECQEWRAWLDGDVYEVIVEQHTAERCWTHQDSLCGLYGWAYARQRATDLLTENAAAAAQPAPAGTRTGPAATTR